MYAQRSIKCVDYATFHCQVRVSAVLSHQLSCTYCNGIRRMVQALAKVAREGRPAGAALRCPERMPCISCAAWSAAASAARAAGAGLQLNYKT